MKNNKSHLQHGSFNNYLKTISDIKFTPREIDVIACILGGRATKTICQFLSIEEKTVEAHKHNIMRKVRCNSKENIIDFVEKSDKYLAVKEHYLALLSRVLFTKAIKEALSLTGKIGSTCSLLYWREQEQETPFVSQLEKHLNLAGFNVTLEVRENYKSLDSFINHLESQAIDYVIYSIPGSLLKQLQEGNNNREILELTHFLQKSSHNPGSVTFLLNYRDITGEIPAKIQDVGYVNWEKQENYYFSVFEILKKMMPNKNLDKIAEDFKKQYESIHNSSEKSPSQIWSEINRVSEEEENSFGSFFLHFFKKSKLALLLGVSLFLMCTFFLVSYLANNQSSSIVSPVVSQKSGPIRSDLPLPVGDTFLKRPSVTMQIEEKLKGPGGIRSLTLLGPGGVGKTSLAREYGRQQNIPVVWEINAETSFSLIHSFETLAYALARNQEEHKILRELEQIQNQKEKETKILLFVKEHLKTYSKWLLIFDNVEAFSDIKNHFPFDQTTWGNGNVILTTRDSNIQNNKYIDYCILVGELSAEEKYALFTKIQEKEVTEVQKTKAFLNEIPPYPLDISTAAYYLKDTKISYTDYLERMRKSDHGFEKSQENLLKEIGEYTKTRYGIITLSLEKLINEHPDFEELLLLISLLDSQDILKDLLVSSKNVAIVERFIHSLRKHSFITSEITNAGVTASSFSIHRSTQLIILAYLTEKLSLKQDKKVLENLCSSFWKYLKEIVNNDNLLSAETFSQVKILVQHVNAFINQSILPKNINTFKIKGELGYLYYWLTFFDKAKEVMEDTSAGLEQTNYKDKSALARILSHLGVLYWNMGCHDKSQELLEKSIQLYNDARIKTDPKLAKTLVYLGMCYVDRGEFKKAVDTLEKSLMLYEKYFPQYDIGLAFASTYLGRVYSSLWDFDKAKLHIEAGIRIYKNYNDYKHMQFSFSLAYLGYVYLYSGDFENAKDLIEDTFTIHQRLYPENSIFTAWALRNLGNVYNELGDYKKSQNCLEKSLAIFERSLGNDNIKTQWVLFELGKAHRNLGNLGKAKAILEDCLVFFKNYYKENHIWKARTLRSLGDIYFLEEDIENAQFYMEEALTLFEQRNDPEIYNSFEQLSDLYLKKAHKETDYSQSQDYKKQAETYMKRAMSIAEKIFPKNSFHLKRLKNKLKYFD